MGVKTRRITQKGQLYGWCVWCPACDDAHLFSNGWTFNGDHERPTFTPSMKVTWTALGVDHCCHSMMTGGVWHYASDCTHAKVNSQVPAPDWPYPHYSSGS